MLRQLFTIATAVCMVVGRDGRVQRLLAYSSLTLDRNRNWQPRTAHGNPRQRRRKRIASLRSSLRSLRAGKPCPLLYFDQPLKTRIDSLCYATYNNSDLRVHEVVCSAFLQKVDPLSLACPHWLTGTARIFKGTFVKPSVYAMIAIVLVWMTAFFFANLFQCWPLWINWVNFGATYENCINTNVMYLAQAWSDVLTDCKKCLASGLHSSNNCTVIILTLPLPCVGHPFSVTQNHC